LWSRNFGIETTAIPGFGIGEKGRDPRIHDPRIAIPICTQFWRGGKAQGAMWLEFGGSLVAYWVHIGAYGWLTGNVCCRTIYSCMLLKTMFIITCRRCEWNWILCFYRARTTGICFINLDICLPFLCVFCRFLCSLSQPHKALFIHIHRNSLRFFWLKWNSGCSWESMSMLYVLIYGQGYEPSKFEVLPFLSFSYQPFTMWIW